MRAALQKHAKALDAERAHNKYEREK